MPWPLSHDFQDAVLNPKLSFADDDLREAEVVKGPTGLPIPASGQFGIVYQMVAKDGRRWALKCFTADVPGRGERYQKIAGHLRACDLPFMVGFDYLDQGVFIQGAWYPVLKMEWVEGQTLNKFVADWLEQTGPLKVLIEMWPRVAQKLREQNVTHADLQHGNVMLVPKAKGSVTLKLVDYDGMFLPELAGTQSGESGHPCYQHPRRLSEGLYTGDVDRFSHLVIYTSLRALAVKGKMLWQTYNNGDNLLFTPVDFQKPRESKALRELWRDGPDDVRVLTGRLVLATQQPLEQIPQIEEVLEGAKVKGLSAAQVKQVCRILDVPEPKPEPPVVERVPKEEPPVVELAPADDDAPIPMQPLQGKSKTEAIRPAIKPLLAPPRPAAPAPTPAVTGQTIVRVLAVLVGIAAMFLITGVIVGLILMTRGKEPVVLSKDPSPTTSASKDKDKDKDKEDGKTPPPPVFQEVILSPATPPWAKFNPHEKPVHHVAFGDNGILATGGEDTFIKVWDVANKKQVRHVAIGATVSALAFPAKDPKLLFHMHSALVVQTTNLGSKGMGAAKNFGKPATSMSVSADGAWVAVAQGNNVELWKLETGLNKALTHAGFIEQTAFFESGKDLWLAAASRDGTVRLWDAGRQKETNRELKCGSPARCVAFSPNGKWIVVGCNDGTIRRWDWKEGPSTLLVDPNDGFGKDWVRSLAFSGDGSFLAAGYQDRIIRLWDVENKRIYFAMDSLQGPVTNLAISPDNRWLAAAVGTEEARIFEISTK